MDQMEGLKAYNCSFERQSKLGKLNCQGKIVMRQQSGLNRGLLIKSYTLFQMWSEL